MSGGRRLSLKLLLGGLAAVGIVLPVCLVGLVRVGLSSSGAAQPFVRFGLVNHEIARATRIGPGGELEGVPGYSPPPGLELVVADEGGRVILSTSDRFALGSRADLGAAAAAAKEDFTAPYFFTEPWSYKDRVVGTYFAWLSRSRFRLEPSVKGSISASLALLFIVSLSFLVGVYVATQLARAVLKLERAAGLIAAGDFGTRVSVSGIREIEDLAAAMDGMRVALLEDRDRRARFLAAISHDLRTPLTSIGGYLEAVSDGLASDPRTLERYVDIMRGKTRLLEGRIAGLIEFARMETSEWRMGFEAVDLRAFLDALVREVREDAALMGRRFEASLDGVDGIRLPIDRGLLSRALENVISNALRYSPEGGLVRLAGCRLGTSMRLDIDDEGPGVPAAEREKVFEPFYRGSGAREGEGTGLGLYIARSIVRGHGWEIEAGESPQGGGRFSISIPAPKLER
jgi:signal transduction histidine kinase